MSFGFSALWRYGSYAFPESVRGKLCCTLILETIYSQDLTSLVLYVPPCCHSYLVSHD